MDVVKGGRDKLRYFYRHLVWLQRFVAH